MVWTKELYLLNGEYHAHAISDYIHGHTKITDILIDNNDTENVETIGNWTSSTNILGYLGDDYIYADTLSPASVIFNATIDTTGTYEVFTRWVSSPDFATNALASFKHSGGTNDFIIDMSLRGGNWVSLDTFNLEAGEQVSLTLSNSNTNKTIIADGLRISKVRECKSVSIQEIQEDQTPLSINLYPNPTNSQFTIQLGNNTKLESVNVYNMLGQLVLSLKESIVDISSLADGFYIVEINTNKGQGLKKLVIQ